MPNQSRQARWVRSIVHSVILLALLAVPLLTLPSAGAATPAATSPAAAVPTDLPGSETIPADALRAAIGWGFPGLIVAASATDEPHELVGGRLPAGYKVVRQSIKVTSVIAGTAEPDQTLTVEYWLHNSDTIHQHAVDKGQHVLWFLASTNGATNKSWQGIKALPDSPENRKLVTSLLPTTPADLPGSEKKTAELLARKDPQRFIIVAQAQDRAFQVDGADMAGARRPMRQSFKVLSAAPATIAGKTIEIDYVVSEEGVHERIIRKGETVIWILTQQDNNFWTGRKALPDTPENRKLVN